MVKLSIIIPVYNEESSVIESLERVTKTIFPIETEYIIVDDNSVDNSLKLINYFAQHSKKDIILIKNKKNLGKGRALIKGLKKATGDIVTFHDADLEYNPEDLKILLKKQISLGENYAVYGSRFIGKKVKWTNPLQYLGNRILSLMINLLYFRMLSDMETCYKMFYLSNLKGVELASNRFEIEPEITINLIKKRIKIKEIPISYSPRTFDKGKKITYKDGFRSLLIILKLRFGL